MPTAITHDPIFNTPVSSTNTAVVRWSGTSGSTLQDCGVLIDGSNNLIIPAQGDLRLSDTTGGQYVALQANGTTTTHTLTFPAAQGGASTVLTNNGSGALTWAAAGATIDDVTATQTINNSTSFQTTTLTLTVAANEDWAWEIYLLYNSNSTADIKFEWQDIPTGLVGHWSALGYAANGTVDIQSKVSLAGDLTAGGQGAVYATHLKGVFITGGTGGTLELNFAQNTANGSNTTVEIGSYLMAHKIR
jgi:hypothetical protein